MTQKEKEMKAEAFINLSDDEKLIDNTPTKAKKESIKPIFIRAPKSYWDSLQEIMALTGLSMNAVCLELLRPGIKKKLRELKEDI